MNKSFLKKINVVVKDVSSQRLDKCLVQLIPEELNLSRSRIKDLISSGAVTDNYGKPLMNPSGKAFPGQIIHIFLAATQDSEIQPQQIKLNIIYEDNDLLVVDKEAGMVVHPAPGAPDATLVNALLFHCGDSLSGIGGKKRPGIVHRIDKDTSGLLVVAKTDNAHQGLARQFFNHSVQRKYKAFVYGKPSHTDQKLQKLPLIEFKSEHTFRIFGRIARHRMDRKKMAVYENHGRTAVTNVLVKKSYGPKENPHAAYIECKIETGRTHQIRAHLNYIGHSIIGDKTYKSKKKSYLSCGSRGFDIVRKLNRQALHASLLGFSHPKSGRWLSFTSEFPNDIQQLFDTLEEI